MSTDIAIRNPIAVPPALAEAGVTVSEEHGVRSVMIPDTLKQRYNIAQPVSEVTQADPDWSPRLVVVDLSGEQYHYNEQGKRSLTKVGILLLAHAAGIEVDVDPMPRDQLRDSEIGFKATATIRRSDGTLAHWTASKVADLVDEEEATKGTNERWPVVKKHLRAKTETKAILRAVSLALQLKRGGYLPAEMLKPFLIVGVSSTPSDPEVRRERALSAAGELYGRRALEAVPEPSLAREPLDEQPPANVVDIKPSAPQEPDPNPIAGEIPPEVAAALEVVFPRSLRASGKKIREVREEYVRNLATSIDEETGEFVYPKRGLEGADDQYAAIAACRVVEAWRQTQSQVST